MSVPSAPGPNVPFPPQEAELVEEIPTGPKWQYEPKWDGFRGVLENDNGELALWSRNGRPLLRYFPELRALGELLPAHSALDGEIVIEREGSLDFDAMQMRLHPAESRIRRLAAETPATYIAFDVLLWKGEPVHERPLVERRKKLLEVASGFTLSLTTTDLPTAKHWLERLEVIGLDGIIAKRIDATYKPGSREVVKKIKYHKTCDCVIVGYRTNGEKIASLLLGLYREDGRLDFVGHTSGIAGPLQKQLQQLLPQQLLLWQQERCNNSCSSSCSSCCSSCSSCWDVLHTLHTHTYTYIHTHIHTHTYIHTHIHTLHMHIH